MKEADRSTKGTRKNTEKKPVRLKKVREIFPRDREEGKKKA